MDKKVFSFLCCLYFCCTGKGSELVNVYEPKVSVFHYVFEGEDSEEDSQVREEESPEECGCGISILELQKIVAGEKQSRPGDYPWMVSVENVERKEHYCSGAVIDESWILTAAHCTPELSSESEGAQVLVGLYKLSNRSASTVQIIQLDKAITHDDFDFITNSNDIGLLKTKEPIDIDGSSGYVNKICLPQDDYVPEGLVRALGWNLDLDEEKDFLFEIAGSIFPWEDCNELYEEEDLVGAKAICASMQSSKDNVCVNYAGGPLFYTEGGKSTIIGIGSLGVRCPHDPGVYTKVAAYIPWIEKVMAEN